MIFNKGLQFEDEIIVTDSQNEFDLVDYKNIFDEKYKDCTQASHCMFYCKSDHPVLNVFKSKAFILMQVRFDGHLGFPGGVLNPGESAEDALNRELKEEMNISPTIELDVEDRIFIHYNKLKSLLLHFFAKEVTEHVFEDIERRCLKAKEYGHEVMGICRVPLFTMNDGYRGFPAFLRNIFIGNAKKQLLESLVLLEIMSEEEINKAINAKPLHFTKPKVPTVEDVEG